MFSNRKYFDEIYPMDKKTNTGQALTTVVVELVVPEELKVDGSKEQNSSGTEFMKCFRRNDIVLTRTKPEIPNHNPAEGVIRKV